jgi:hypothetical protein
MLCTLYPEKTEFASLLKQYDNLGRKINSYIQYVEDNWMGQEPGTAPR